MASSRGQALAEGVVMLAVMVLLFLATGWIWRLQDLGLQTQHAARLAAFDQARRSQHPALSVRAAYFQPVAQTWNDPSGRAWIQDSAKQVQVSLLRLKPLVAEAQPGRAGADETVLRSQWSLADQGVLQAVVSVQPQSNLFGPAPVLRRQLHILVDAGAGVSASQTDNRVASSALAWRDAWQTSRAVGKQLAQHLKMVDAGWGRAEAGFDWLSPWSDEVPSKHVTTFEWGATE